MQIGCLTSHSLQDASLVPSVWELRQLDAAAVRPQSANDPTILHGIIWIRLSDGVLSRSPHRECRSATGQERPYANKAHLFEIAHSGVPDFNIGRQNGVIRQAPR